MEIWIFGFEGGYSPTSDLALRKKSWQVGGGILKLKSHKVARSKVSIFLGGYSETQVKVPRSLTIFSNFGFGLSAKISDKFGGGVF